MGEGNISIHGKKDSQATVLFSVNPPGLQRFTAANKSPNSYAYFEICTHTTLTLTL